VKERARDAVSDLHGDSVFVPNLCGVESILVIVLLCELAALIIVIAGSGFGARFVDDLALMSIYTQWLGLTAAASLCWARKLLLGRAERTVAITSFALVLLVAVAVAECAWWVVNPVVGAGAIIPIAHAELVWRTLAVSAIVAVLALRYFYVQFHWRQRIASEAEARLEALQARIRPHFFFNCMNTIASLTRSDAQAAERAVEDLADLFRASLADARAPVPVATEIDFVERYLNIERLRLGTRLAVEWDIDELPAGARLPRLSLQPIVENAIYHGIEPARAGGTIAITARVHDDMLEITVANPVNAAPDPRHHGNRLALANVRQRLATLFGTRARLDAGAAGDRYLVCLAVPLDPAR